MMHYVPFAQLSQVPAQMYQFIWLVMLFSFLLMLLGLSYFARRVTEPIRRLSQAMERFGKGMHGERVFLNRGDEIGALGTHFNGMADQITNYMRLSEEYHRARTRLELSVLENQINPHFLYNTLDLIHWKATHAGNTDISAMTTYLARFFRLGLHMGQEFIPVSDEIEHARMYLLICKMRYGDSFSYEIRVEPTMESCRIKKTLLQPLLENTAKYGLRRNGAENRLTVRGWTDGAWILLSVADIGPGMTPGCLREVTQSMRSDELSAETGSLGLHNLYARLNFALREHDIQLSSTLWYNVLSSIHRGEGETAMRYYVQDIAVNYQRNLAAEPSAYAVHPSNLYGIDEAEMKSGYRALLLLFGQLYRDIEADPGSFSMLLRESLVPDAKDSAYTLSNQSLARVPNLLFAFGVWGGLDADGALGVGGDVLNEAVKTLKITKAIPLMEQLSQYGLEITGVGKTLGPQDRIELRYPDNRFFPAALKAAASAMLAINKGNPKRGKDLFYALHAGLLEAAPGKAPNLSLEDMCRTISPERAEIARQFDRIISPYAKRKVTMSGIMRNDWGCVYTLTANKRVVLTLNVNQQALHVKMNLAHLEGYTDLLDACSDALRDSMLSTWDCGHCNSGCAGGFQFTYQNKAYNKCRGGAFQVPDVRADQVEDCIRFLEKEAQASA